ncbi:MAG: hypothetical protein P4M11_00130 [Candidatus Pacebacteria bacterium]|nr:hypothetical protein [Candidatus Paceibacterota bacterium]
MKKTVVKPKEEQKAASSPAVKPSKGVPVKSAAPLHTINPPALPSKKPNANPVTESVSHSSNVAPAHDHLAPKAQVQPKINVETPRTNKTMEQLNAEKEVAPEAGACVDVTSVRVASPMVSPTIPFVRADVLPTTRTAFAGVFTSLLLLV